jgi:hypothetical protein
VPDKTIKNAVERQVQKARQNMTSLSKQLQNQEITLQEWRQGMLKEIKTAHIASSVAAKGGWAQMQPSDWGRAGQRIQGQYDYLNKFSSEVQYGKQPLDGHFLARADMYGSAARSTYQDARLTQQKRDGGKTEKMSVKGNADHCSDSDYAPGCLEEAAKGWVPIDSDEVSEPGERTCMTNCHCHWIFR